jgi:hypothetical protein
MAVAVVLGLVDLALGAPIFVALALVQLAAFGAALFVFRRNHRLAPLIATLTVVGLAVLFLSVIPSGGLSSAAANLIWVILVHSARAVSRSEGHRTALGMSSLVVLLAVVIDRSSQRRRGNRRWQGSWSRRST